MAEDWDKIEDWEAGELLAQERSIPITNRITGTLSTIIDDYIIKHSDTEHRQYIGASSIGSPCERKLWYGYKGIAGLPTEPQMQRTFDIGKRLEGLVLDYLEEAGLWIERKPSMLYYRDDYSGLQGHADALWYQEGRNALLEVKTARDSSFRVFVKKGLAEWYPVYMAQVQAYMGMSGIKEAYVIAINKDTSELHDEHVSFDPEIYERLQSKALRISMAEEAPNRINQNRSFFVCRNCQYRDVCHPIKDVAHA